MLDAEKAAEGVIRSVKGFVERAVGPLTNRVDDLDAKFKEVSTITEDLSDERMDGRINGMEARLAESSAASIAAAIEPVALKLAGIEARVEEAANTERFRPFLETALDAVRKEGDTVDEKIDRIEKRLEKTVDANVASAVGSLTEYVGVLSARLNALAKTVPPDQSENVSKALEDIESVGKRLDEIKSRFEDETLAIVSVAVTPLAEQINDLHRCFEDVAKTIPSDSSEEMRVLGGNVDATATRIDDFEKRVDAAMAAYAAGLDPLDRKLAGLDERVDAVSKAMPADTTEQVRAAREEIAAVGKRIDEIYPRIETVSKAAADAVSPLVGKVEDLSARFSDIDAANDALQEQILKSVYVQLEEAVKLLPPPKDGEPGKDGVSAYQIAVTKGFSGSEDEWLGSLKGFAGKDGESIIGPQGDPGKDAEPVDPEAIRSEIAKAVAEIPKPEIPIALVTDMVRGEVSKAVELIPKPQDGKDGLAGKDAEPIDIEKIVADIVARIPMPKDGEPGPPGESIVGPKGDTGDRGERGDAIKGDPGANAYQLALEEGFAGTKAQWVESLTGKSGLAGRDGKDGRDAREPRDGKDGEPGRDALQIEVLPMIDAAKSYPRGTFASHNGGLWRAVRNTDAGAELHLCGWQSIVEGFPEIEIDQGDDLRTFTLRAVSSSGRSFEKIFSLPVVLDRGVFKVDKRYEAGDAISYRGCAWIAQTKTQSVPGNNDDWRMSVKAGRDGKDAALLSPKPPQQVRIK